MHESCRRMMLQAPELRVQQIHCKRPGAREVEPEITCRGERERERPAPSADQIWSSEGPGAATAASVGDRPRLGGCLQCA